MQSERPWTPHHMPTTDEVKRAIHSQFPDVSVEGLEHLGSGWEFDAYLTPDG